MWEDHCSLLSFYLFFRYVLLNAIVLWAIFIKHLFPLQWLTVGIICSPLNLEAKKLKINSEWKCQGMCMLALIVSLSIHLCLHMHMQG